MKSPLPDLFQPHPNLGDEINRNIVQSEIEGGVNVRDLMPGEVLEIETEDCLYTFVYKGDGAGLLAGHPRLCPEPVRVLIHGSTWGGSMLKMGFIGRGMYLEWQHPRYRTMLTSAILEVRQTETVEVAA